MKRLPAFLSLFLLAALWAHGGLVPAAASEQRASSETKTAVQALAQTGRHARVDSGQAFFGDAQYTGPEACKTCHEPQYRTWAASWHSKMEQWPSANTVVGDFDNRAIQFRNLRVRASDGREATVSPTAQAFRRGDRYYFTLLDRDEAANNQTWEVAKVLGGRWDQGYEVKLGDDNYLPAPLRWSVEQKDWIVGGFNPQDWFIADGTADGRPLRRDEMPWGRVAEAKCNGCHTTGFRYAKDQSGVWKSRAHGRGEIGIGCESCHGPGARHVDEAEAVQRAGRRLAPGKTAIVNPLTDLNAEQATQVCGQCHGRGSHKQMTELSFPTGFLPGDTDLTERFRLWSHSGTSNKAESDYFWRNDWASRNRQQYQDFTKSSHYRQAGMSCITCHTFHGEPKASQLRSKPEVMCVECHRAGGLAARPNAEMYAGSDKEQAGVLCIDCHMARIGSRSRATSRAGHQWDTSSHVFAVPTPLMEKYLGVRSACTSCHVEQVTSAKGAGESASSRHSTQAELIDLMRSRGNEVVAALAEAHLLLERVDQRDPTARALWLDARSKLDFVSMDNSKGVHNPGLTKRLLREAKELGRRALAK